MKRSILLISLIPAICLADSNSGNIVVTATVPYILNIQDASVDMQVGNYQEAQTEIIDNWSIWSNAAGPLQIHVSSQDNAMLQSTSGPDPHMAYSMPYTITYTSCGGDAYDITPRSGSASQVIDYRYASFNACESSPGILTLTRLPMDKAPKSGDYVSHVVLTVQEPV